MRRLSRSMLYAARGAQYAFKSEKNFQLEVLFAVAVLALMYLFDLHRQDKLLIILVIVWVLVLELINTAMERVMDMLKPRVHPYVRIVKDVMAAAVLISSFGAMIIGATVFSPHIIPFVEKIF